MGRPCLDKNCEKLKLFLTCLKKNTVAERRNSVTEFTNINSIFMTGKVFYSFLNFFYGIATFRPRPKNKIKISYRIAHKIRN